MSGRLAVFAAALAGSAVLGVAAGLIWAVLAPRALLQEVGHGEAQLVNAESSARASAALDSFIGIRVQFPRVRPKLLTRQTQPPTV